MLNRLLRTALLCLLPGAAHAQTAVPEPTEPTSMRFEWLKEGPAEVCGDHCREWIAATGPITPESARDFEFFAEARPLRGATLVLDSGGGSVLASLELGRKVRQLGLRTTVGRSLKLPTPAGELQHAKQSPRGECASMCVFVLLGGVERTVPAEARILVHQIWPGGKRQDADAESYTAEEVVRVQRDVGRIAKYTVDMGGDIELFELAMRIPPWERLRALTPAELRRVRLQTIDGVAEAPTSGAIAVARPSQAQALRLSERGWTLSDTAAAHALLRRHPLTFEGEDLGSFEISLACGTSSDAFKVAYLETRALGEAAQPIALKDVYLWADGVRVALTVDSSTPAADEIRTMASGSVPAAFIKKLRDDPELTLTVGTKAADGLRTSIRMGSTGFGQAFPKMAADCVK
jgi:hypothetical protein